MEKSKIDLSRGVENDVTEINSKLQIAANDIDKLERDKLQIDRDSESKIERISHQEEEIQTLNQDLHRMKKRINLISTKTVNNHDHEDINDVRRTIDALNHEIEDLKRRI